MEGNLRKWLVVEEVVKSADKRFTAVFFHPWWAVVRTGGVHHRDHRATGRQGDRGEGGGGGGPLANEDRNRDAKAGGAR